jgi:hypothetical protein
MQHCTELPLVKRPAGQAQSSSGRPLVAPHPLDFDWRFTRPTVGLIWETIAELANPESGIALLGTPSLASAKRPTNLGTVTLFERNPNHYRSVSDGITFACCDVLRDPIAAGTNSVVVADPPWYEAETIGFLWTASTLGGTRAHILLSLPPVETRPGIAEERERITTAAAGFGLELVRLIEGVLGYRTPFFEANAMEAAGMSMPPDWRVGDLAVFRRTDAICGRRPVLESEPEWLERSMGLTRFKLREAAMTEFASPVLISIIPNDVLPSVSRRDPRRTGASVWTSGNRIFGCQGTGTLATVIDGMNAGEPPEITIGMQLGRLLTSSETTLVESAVQQVRNVVKYESVELRRNNTSSRFSRLGPLRHRPTTLERAG